MTEELPLNHDMKLDKVLEIHDYYALIARDNSKNHNCIIQDCKKPMGTMHSKKNKLCHLLCHDCRKSLHTILKRVKRFGISIPNTSTL